MRIFNFVREEVEAAETKRLEQEHEAEDAHKKYTHKQQQQKLCRFLTFLSVAGKKYTTKKK